MKRGLAGILVLVFAFLAIGCGEGRSASGLKKYWQLPAFELVDQGGHSFAASQLEGKVWVVDFFYSSCPGTCPMLTSRLSALHQKFKGSEGVRFLSISTDPEKDTTAVLSEYAAKFKADARWLFLTGKKDDIYSLANKGFKLSLTEAPGSAEPITHSTKLVLVDKSGWVRGFYETAGEGSKGMEEKILRDIQILEKEKQ